MVNCFAKCFNEFVEILFVKKDFVSVVAVVIKTFTAFSNCQIIIIVPCCLHIKKISSSFASTNTLTVDAFHFLVIVLVRHSFKFYSLKILVDIAYKYKYVFETAKSKKNHELSVRFAMWRLLIYTSMTSSCSCCLAYSVA